MLPDKQLLELFGPNIKYPHGGRHKMLIWYAHNEGHHYLLARTDKALYQTWGAVFAKERGGLEPKEYWDINIVAPPVTIQLDIARAKYQSSVFGFKYFLMHRVMQEIKEGKPPRPGFSKCTSFKYKYDDDDEKDEEEDPDHFYCANCDERVISTRDFEQEHDMLLDWWLTYESRKNVEKFDRLDEDMPGHSFAECLYAASLHGGHHRPGVGYKNTADYYTNGEDPHFPDPILFFFQGKQLQVPDEFIKLTKDWEAARKADQKASNAHHKAMRKKHDEEDLKNFEAVLAGKDPRLVR